MRIALILALALTPPARAGLEVWDTGKASAEAYSAAAVEAKSGWTKLAEPGAVQGDAVLTNGRITAVIRRNGGTDLYSATAARARSAYCAGVLAPPYQPLAYAGMRSWQRPPSRRYSGWLHALATMSHRAISTPLIAVITVAPP